MPGRVIVVAVALVALLFAGCQRQLTPEETLRSAIVEAHEGDLDGFLSHFDLSSGERLGTFWATSNRYGYLNEDSLKYLNELTVVGSEASVEDGVNWTRLTVDDGERQGDICLKMEEGKWLIALGPGSPCERNRP